MKKRKSSGQPKPWLDEKGERLEDVEIERISKNWDLETWTDYLDNTVDQPASSELSAQDIEDFLRDAFSADDDEYSGRRLDPKLAREIVRIKRSLPHQQYQIIHLLFWKSSTEREVAKLLRTSRGTVARQKQSSLWKFANLLQIYAGARPYVYTALKSNPLFANCRDAEIREVYLSEVHRRPLQAEKGS